MPTLLVTYEAGGLEQDYQDLQTKITTFPWRRLSTNTYVISTRADPQTVYKRLKQFLQPYDKLYVFTIQKPYIGVGLKNVNDWLDENLTG